MSLFSSSSFPHDRYEKISKIGRGGYGKVYKARRRSDGALVAIKKTTRFAFVKREVALSESVFTEESRDFVCFPTRLLESPNGVDFFVEYPLYDTDLSVLIEEYKEDRDRLRWLFSRAVACLDYLHTRGIMHRDVKPSNFFFSRSKNRLVLGDLGNAVRVGDSKFTQRIQTLSYKAPEVILGDGRYNESVDIWSLGCILAEVLNPQSVPLFSGNNDFSLMKSIVSILGAPGENNWRGYSKLPVPLIFKETPKKLRSLYDSFESEGVDLLCSILVYDPSLRPSTRQILRHPYVSGAGGTQKAPLLL